MSFLSAAIAAPAAGALGLLPTLVPLRLYPGKYFPNLIGQMRDTVRGWRPSRDA